MPTGPEALEELVDGVEELKTMVAESLGAKAISSTTRDSVVELAALRGSSYLEAYFEAVFILMLSEDPTVPSSGAVIRARDAVDVELLLRTSGSRKERWSTWLPFDTLLGSADSYLMPDHAFARLRYRPTEKQGLSELSVVRNAVAHPSDHAGRELQALAAKKQYSVSRPADYLRSMRAGNTEIMLLLTNVLIVARAIMAPSELEADLMLSAEAKFSSGQSGPAGRYVCMRCSSEYVHSVPGKLEICDACPPATACPSCGKSRNASSTWSRVIA